MTTLEPEKRGYKLNLMLTNHIPYLKIANGPWAPCLSLGEGSMGQLRKYIDVILLLYPHPDVTADRRCPENSKCSEYSKSHSGSSMKPGLC